MATHRTLATLALLASPLAILLSCFGASGHKGPRTPHFDGAHPDGRGRQTSPIPFAPTGSVPSPSSTRHAMPLPAFACEALPIRARARRSRLRISEGSPARAWIDAKRHSAYAPKRRVMRNGSPKILPIARSAIARV